MNRQVIKLEEDGKRDGDADTLSALKTCQKEINRIKRSISKLKKPIKAKFDKLQRLRKEWKRIRGKGGSVTETKNERVVTLNRNPKEPDMMEKLTFGLDVLNSFGIMSIDGKKYSFSLCDEVQFGQLFNSADSHVLATMKSLILFFQLQLRPVSEK
jgi:predicted RNase H-like nuclease (RuvC/YqgF family)